MCFALWFPARLTYFWLPNWSCMKKIFLAAFAAILFSGLNAQTSHTETKAEQQPNDVLFLKQEVHDFGQIPQGKPVYYYFEIVNKGATPLKLESVSATCGCTTPEWNKGEIAPGSSDKIKVGYNSAAEGPFEKFITIAYNGTQTKQLKIKGTVWKAPEGSAPGNVSVQFLKQQIQ